MKVAITYIYPLNGAECHMDCALKFLDTYHRHPPGMDHDTVIICNGSPVTDEARFLFGSMPNPTLIEHDGSGKDIGGYQLAARVYPCDLMVFFGGNTYLKRGGWLVRMVEAWRKHGDTLYGAMGNAGVEHAWVYPHIRTTGFWMSPSLLNQYPIKVTDTGRHGPRYEFEHGITGLTMWIHKQNKMAWVVGWDGEYTRHQWNGVPNGFHSGDQSNMLCGDRMSAPPYWPCE